MQSLVKTISQYIESQFPGIYREDAQELIAFIQAYYEFLEQTDNYNLKLLRTAYENNDIDETLDKFLVYYKEKYLTNFPYNTQTDKRFIIKHIMDFYRTKGSKQSLQLLMNMLYAEETDIYYPGQDVLRVSDSKWYVPIYLELTSSPRTAGFQNKQITGSRSGAQAFVEGVVTKKVNGKIIDVAYLSDVRGIFQTDEIVTENGDLEDAPQVVGSLTSVDVTFGGDDFAVGDLVNIGSSEGRQAKARVSAVKAATGLVEFELIDGGFGFTNNSFTDVYVSNTVIFVDNPNLSYIDFEKVRQPIEKVYTLSSEDINTSANVGDVIQGYNGSDELVATGYVISVANTDANGDVVTANSAQSLITVIVESGTFANQISIELTSNANFQTSEVVSEESSYIITVTFDANTFTTSEEVRISSISANGTILSISNGIVQSVNNDVVEITDFFGTIEVGDVLVGQTSNNTATVESIESSSIGARGIISSKVSNDTYVVRDIFGVFDNGNKIRGNLTRTIATIANTALTGASDVIVANTASVNGVVDIVESAFAEGIVVGQNTTAIGVYGNTAPFYFVEGANFITINTVRSEIIAPPLDANGQIIEVSDVVNRVSTGSSANFELGYIENTENVTLNTDIVGSNNVLSIPYKDIQINGEGSGIGFVDSVDVIEAGSGYSNGEVVYFNGGGYIDGNPLVAALGSITTDANGAITTVTVTNPGAGYFSVPTLEVDSLLGSSANLAINMDFGWGFPALPDGDVSNIIGDLLTNESMTIGTIGSIYRVNPGGSYNTAPFVRIHNPYISGLDRRDIILDITNASGGFRIGERVYQTVDASSNTTGTFYKGVVLSANTSKIVLDRRNLNVGFDLDEGIFGELSLSSANISLVSQDASSRPIGDNANVVADVITSNGVISTVEVYDSGYGYTDGSSVTISMANNAIVASGTARVLRQGVSEGYWTTTNSHLNSEKKIHDNNYYQEYSYDIQTGTSLNRYENVVLDVVHIAGTKLFGTVNKKSTVTIPVDIAESTIESANTDYFDSN